MGGAAGENESAEHEEKPVERDITPFADEIDEHQRDGIIGENDDGIGNDVKPNNIGLPQVTVAMGHKVVRNEQLLEEFEHNISR
jgi:hypothetical protein